MSRRWCIIAGPRSGSTWFETMIFKKIKSIDSRTEMLGEFLEPVLNLNFIIDEYRNLKNNGFNKDLLSISRLIDDRIDLIQNTRENQPLIMRIFPKNNVYSDYKFQNFIDILKKKKFNFVILNRDLLQRSISLYFMIETNIVHRFSDRIYTQTRAVSDDLLYEKETITPTLIKMNIDQINNILKDEYITENNIKKMNSLLGCAAVEYENLIEDCKNKNIPIDPNVTIQTTYDIRYKDVIENYDEVISFYEELKNGNFKI